MRRLKVLCLMAVLVMTPLFFYGVQVIDLAAQVFGVLPTANGGTGNTTNTSANTLAVNGASVPTTSAGPVATNSSGQIITQPPAVAIATRTSSLTATTLCSQTNCPAGIYLLSLYANETGTHCTTVGSGAIQFQVTYVDPNATQTANPIGGSAGAAATVYKLTPTASANGFLQATYTVMTSGAAVTGTDAMQISTTVTACGTVGTWSGYQAKIAITRVG